MRFDGIIPALTTPFDDRGQVDFEALAANVEAMIGAGDRRIGLEIRSLVVHW